MSGFQKGATYEQIKAYVLKHTGLKVSSLYISQVKRKCGLDVGQNYNLSKNEECQSAKMPAGKGSGDYGGTEVFSDDLRAILNVKAGISQKSEAPAFLLSAKIL